MVIAFIYLKKLLFKKYNKWQRDILKKKNKIFIFNLILDLTIKEYN